MRIGGFKYLKTSNPHVGSLLFEYRNRLLDLIGS